MSNYPHGVSTHDIPGWDEIDIDKCREEINGDTRRCKEKCSGERFFECAMEAHIDGKHFDDCPICENERVEMEYLREGER